MRYPTSTSFVRDAENYEGISDLNFSVGHPYKSKISANCKPVFVEPAIDPDTVSNGTDRVTLMQGNRR